MHSALRSSLGRISAAVTAVISGFAWTGMCQARETAPKQYRWRELENRIEGKRIAFVQADGTEVTGKVLAVEPSGLRLDVKKTSNTAVVGKGIRVIPRESVSMLRVDNTGKKWRIILTVAIPFSVMGAIAGAAGDLPEPGASGGRAVAAGVFGSIAGGYLLGWSLDKKSTEIAIIKE